MNTSIKETSIWDKVATNFGNAGPKYWNEFGNRLVELSNISSGARVLDIGMGRGASFFPEINKVGKDGYVIGIDSSEVMVTETYQDMLHRGICNAEVKHMNASKLEFEEGSFDNIFCGFGFGYLLSSEDKLMGVLKLLKSGGQAGFSIWGVQEDQKWLTEVINKYLPPVKNTDKDCKLDIPKFETVEDILHILHNSGFEHIKVHQENPDVVYNSKEEWWEEMCSNAVSAIFERIEELGNSVFIEFKKDIFKGLSRFYRGEKLYINMPVIYAFGEKIK